jgi:predicted DNA-binding transcriptional regulator AlpA
MSGLFSTRQAAKKLGIDVSTLSRHVSSGKVPAPRIMDIGGNKVHSWTEEDIERVRVLLPKIKNGRKTWRQKKKQTEKKAKPKKK